jgi:hypothetical protein
VTSNLSHSASSVWFSKGLVTWFVLAPRIHVAALAALRLCFRLCAAARPYAACARCSCFTPRIHAELKHVIALPTALCL